MGAAEAVFLLLFVVLPVVLVGTIFVWAAVKDGQEDEAHHALFGRRRRRRRDR